MGISDQTTDQIDHEIGKAAMTGVFNLGNVLELVNDGLNHRPLPLPELVSHVHEAIFHSGFDLGNELDTVFPELFEQSLRQITFVAEELTKEPFDQLGNGTPIIDVARRQTTGQ